MLFIAFLFVKTAAMTFHNGTVVEQETRTYSTYDRATVQVLGTVLFLCGSRQDVVNISNEPPFLLSETKYLTYYSYQF